MRRQFPNSRSFDICIKRIGSQQLWPSVEDCSRPLATQQKGSQDTSTLTACSSFPPFGHIALSSGTEEGNRVEGSLGGWREVISHSFYLLPFCIHFCPSISENVCPRHKDHTKPHQLLHLCEICCLKSKEKDKLPSMLTLEETLRTERHFIPET